ncbi:MAG: hypothetical protein G01um101430_587 [Parcubacteria group bacterium Gr01-1014_30]|nr:MAG: hypothetical protein G01um101430_587 [Parcubacteria group bacterium Gr01-1014_30]
MTTQTAEKIQKARRDIARVLERYRVTLPEVIGSARYYDEKEDERFWREIAPTYRKVRKEVFAEFYPDLAKKNRKGKNK